jgi:hypothetical protein
MIEAVDASLDADGARITLAPPHAREPRVRLVT